jgi:methylmalonyl-CoA mutase cobalamin-binding subunit
LRDHGQEVVLLGAVSATEAVSVAVQEDAAILGFSCYCGGEMEFGIALVDQASKQGYSGELWAGGLVSEDLRSIGFKLPLDITGKEM